MSAEFLKVGDHVFRCEEELETWRVQTLFTKEAGTIDWLKASLTPGEVFYDVGANIGLYTIVAASLVGAIGKVYAFEPHLANAASLAQNILVNQFTDRVSLLTMALHDQCKVVPFNYFNLIAGSSGSQLGHTMTEHDKPFTPALTESKWATTIDYLIDFSIARPPHVIKIDVDGNELAVLRGMHTLLTSPDRPRTIQVETRPRDRQALLDFMQEAGFTFNHRHDTMYGKQLVERGTNPDEIAHNSVFVQG